MGRSSRGCRGGGGALGASRTQAFGAPYQHHDEVKQIGPLLYVRD